MEISDLGEFGLIKLLSTALEQKRGPQPELIIGIGDDAAAWRSTESTTLATTDTLVEGIHFTSQCTWEEVGWKALAINLSDIAAMGGIPQYALTALTLPMNMQAEDVVHLYEGMAKAARDFNVTIAGGNISRAPTVTITVTLIGKAHKDGVLTRSTAKPRDMIAVTGYLGSSAAGQTMLRENLLFDSATTAFLREAHTHPEPRLSEGQLLVTLGVQTAIDISDGLISDMAHVCEESGVGARLNTDELPIHSLVQSAFPNKAIGFALSGGEDYELLFTAGRETIARVKQQMRCPTTVIGEVTHSMPEKVMLVNREGKPVLREQKGWDHFSRAS